MCVCGGVGGGSGEGQGLVPRGPLFTGEVILQRGEEVTDHRHAPGPAQQLLSSPSTHVGHVCVVDRKAKNPAGKTHTQRSQGKGHVGTKQAETYTLCVNANDECKQIKRQLP